MSLLSSMDIGSMNRARVMRHLYASGPLSRAELAFRLQVSRATIGTLVQPLLDSKVLVEQDPKAAGELGGKPARPLWFGTKRSLGAVFLSADECTVALVGLDGTVLDEQRQPIVDDEPEPLMRQVRDSCVQVLADHQIAGIGVAMAGMVDTTSGELLANYRRPALGRLPVSTVLGDTLHVPVFADHHPRVTALGDAWFGLARGRDTFASIITGEVLGVGMMQNGQTLRGIRGAGGEVGHIVVEMGGTPCLCGRRGCWETVATLGWLRARARELGLPEPGRMSSARLVADPLMGGILDEYVSRLSLGLANIEQMLGLGTYILHGDAVGGGETMRALLERELVVNSPDRQPPPRILFASDPDESTLRGAAGLVLTNVYRARL